MRDSWDVSQLDGFSRIAQICGSISYLASDPSLHTMTKDPTAACSIYSQKVPPFKCTQISSALYAFAQGQLQLQYPDITDSAASPSSLSDLGCYDLYEQPFYDDRSSAVPFGEASVAESYPGQCDYIVSSSVHAIPEHAISTKYYELRDPNSYIDNTVLVEPWSNPSLTPSNLIPPHPGTNTPRPGASKAREGSTSTVRSYPYHTRPKQRRNGGDPGGRSGPWHSHIAQEAESPSIGLKHLEDLLSIPRYDDHIKVEDVMKTPIVPSQHTFPFASEAKRELLNELREVATWEPTTADLVARSAIAVSHGPLALPSRNCPGTSNQQLIIDVARRRCAATGRVHGSVADVEEELQAQYGSLPDRRTPADLLLLFTGNAPRGNRNASTPPHAIVACAFVTWAPFTPSLGLLSSRFVRSSSPRANTLSETGH
ncbi:hypothetical protein A0H81_09462 [Grifola frondosa]|uniref:Uncharacterized protein n=1 Tax=Grifola frondosa TaxID=5627 RepID=A0A1C7M165_GRIFR|nr:hypothetical protein A0H81_09462 [Grifola frondosa]